MQKFLSGLFFFLVSTHTLAMTIPQSVNLNARIAWQLANPLPDNVPIPAQASKHTIVVHVNKYFKARTSLTPDTIEIICGDHLIFLKAGATGSCDLPNNVSASFGILSSNFHNGSEGVIMFK